MGCWLCAGRNVRCLLGSRCTLNNSSSWRDQCLFLKTYFKDLRVTVLGCLWKGVAKKQSEIKTEGAWRCTGIVVGNSSPENPTRLTMSLYARCWSVCFCDEFARTVGLGLYAKKNVMQLMQLGLKATLHCFGHIWVALMTRQHFYLGKVRLTKRQRKKIKKCFQELTTTQHHQMRLALLPVHCVQPKPSPLHDPMPLSRLEGRSSSCLRPALQHLVIQTAESKKENLQQFCTRQYVSLSISLPISLPTSLSISIYLYLSLSTSTSLSLSPYLPISLSLYLSISLSLYLSISRSFYLSIVSILSIISILQSYLSYLSYPSYLS